MEFIKVIDTSISCTIITKGTNYTKGTTHRQVGSPLCKLMVKYTYNLYSIDMAYSANILLRLWAFLMA